MSDESAESTPARPDLRVVRGTPTPEELAALVAVVASLGGGEEPARRP
ncbi:MAG: acyl-CoA carboxylase subunit epsilon, partial [Nocardioides sp.]